MGLRVIQDIHITMNSKIVLPVLLVLACAAYTQAGRIFILDDGVEDKPVMRVRRDSGYAPPVHAAPTYHAAPKGRVGPVYPFVKPDPQANFKWGVRHRAGSQYGR